MSNQSSISNNWGALPTPDVAVVANEVEAALYLGEALSVMKRLPDASVDLIAVDLPYGVTQNKWDSVIPLEEMWSEFRRVRKPKGAVVLTATQPFTSALVVSNLKEFKYDIIWEKSICSGQLNVKHQPMRAHESVLVFCEGRTTYNEQLLPGEPYQIKRKAKFEGPGYGAQRESEKANTGYRHAKSVLAISNPRVKGGHPTQKPEDLMRWLIRTYSNPGEVVLDCCLGSGTTGVAALREGRKFIGIELDEVYFQGAAQRIANAADL